MSIMKFLRTLTLTTVLVAATVLAQTPYDEGQKALREQNWTEAADQFKQAIKSDKENVDASMYWRAHALYQAGRNKEAERQVKTLARKYPGSRWIKEAQVLQIEHNGSAQMLATAKEESLMDEELRMFALVQLMERDPQRALPLVMDMIQSTDSKSVSSDMLFMLGMSEDPQAQQMIARIARDSDDDVASDYLISLYPDGTVDEKQAVIQSMMIMDHTEGLISLLKMETDPDRKREMLQMLTMMDSEQADEYLFELLEDKG